MAAAPAPTPPAAPVAPFEPPRKASLYVGDLDPEVTEKELLEAFSVMGPVLSIRVCRDKLSHKSLCYAYVNFLSLSDASKALACLNHTDLKGKPMRIMWCQRDPRARKTGVGNLFVKNLDRSVTNASLQSIFCKFGTVLSCKVAEENGKSKGFGFVQFEEVESAMAALDALHGTMHLGKKLYVSKFVKQERKDGNPEPIFTNLYVKNLDEDVTEDLLRDKFLVYGKIHNVVIMKDAEGKSRGFGFVNFELHEDAKKAVEALNGAELGSKKLFVGKAQKKAERKEFLKREYQEMLIRRAEKSKASNLYVRNLDESVDDRKLQEHFSAFGKVISAKVMRQGSGISKGFGFVSFSIPEEANKAIHACNGAIFQGKSLYVAIAQRKEERCRELQAYYNQYPSQYFYASHWEIPAPQLRLPHYNLPLYPPLSSALNIKSQQPTVYQNFGTNVGSLYPFTAQSYQANISTYANCRSHKDPKPSGKFGNKRSATEKASLKEPAKRDLIAASSPGKCKENFGELFNHVKKLQRW